MHSVSVAGDADHSRMRKVLGHAFSERALREQELPIQNHVKSLLEGLERERLDKDGVVDFVKWYNWAAFDIIADVSFGKPFNCLEEPIYRQWVILLSRTWKVITFLSAFKSITPSLKVLYFLLPKSIVRKQLDKFHILLNRVRSRQAQGPSRADLVWFITNHNNEKKLMTDAEIQSNVSLFVGAGTETVATLLPGVTYLFVKTPRVMNKLKKELRLAFPTEALITVQSVSQMSYLTACIQEGLRLFPPVPEGLPRVVPSEGETVCGRWVPGGTFVQVSTLAANLAAVNFAEPKSFIPERWLHTEARFAADKHDASQPFSIDLMSCIGRK
ncbi:MAG: hypothetical protein Q9187_003823 [Circinaria calcarea]